MDSKLGMRPPPTCTWD